MRRRQIQAERMRAAETAVTVRDAKKQAMADAGEVPVKGGVTIRELRENAGLSHAELAELAGVSVAYMRTIEAADLKRDQVLEVFR